MDTVNSLDVVEDVVRRELAARERRGDAADTRAGLVLAFAGLLVSLGGGGWRPLAVAARLTAAVAALVALRATGVTLPPVYDMRRVREQYLGAHPDRTRLLLLDADLYMLDELARQVRAKVARARLAAVLVAVALVLSGAAATVG